MVINQYEIYLINLDPTVGFETQKSRPCIVISPNEINQFIGTVMIAPMTTASKNYPTRVELTFQGKKGSIVLDQIRTVDKSRLVQKLGSADSKTIQKIKKVIKEMLVD
ncbi:type II toxin-antitoxin system PemK/MazF family toxin [Leptospira bandrabouensis]|uniref:mRNA interferase n=1 Tax=Leptospira bandrabouensis TaxID=2484903 RepID=A0A6H3NSG5_9LEPT|nr:type II toxin-antitoxin system PemK/MazF family toxin [Leptospira bandrabouensis]MCG6143285.1 type II toxin-antitoxin system PemK/MazF family toxin [Leptospira bandrabouensis]MCG6158945.1 type II toxin-antitoxin system PemK/MazF family toxin [Leptospira bandrabouensis]MCG6162879.1 type II toxin-antitoxin system PemK/MazF family toxin [Leptospira bandrabouensis]MCW7458277.1 type II toxin-antitoxin system PemK/MazF family toxin [Leptospira bandrabouensis]MCW7476939.1 type II toxin-antitoxin s